MFTVLLQREERGCHDLLHCYILFFIGQNFIHFYDSGKMPSDKKALCNLTHITPAPFAIYLLCANHDDIATKPLIRIGSF
jgi:hypothetical protein